jgi:hypothetical protein
MQHGQTEICSQSRTSILEQLRFSRILMSDTFTKQRNDYVMKLSDHISTKISLAVLDAILLFSLGCGTQSPRNSCPIDGSLPQGISKRNGNSCEYFHYSIVERQTHSWWAECGK